MDLEGLFRRDDTALLVIDMQNAFCHLQGGFAKAGRDVSFANSIIPTVVRLVRGAHDAGLPVIWTLQEHLGEQDVAGRTRRVPSHMAKFGVAKQHWSLRNTWDAELVDELKSEVRPEDHIVHKHKMSAFYSTTLEALMHVKRLQFLVICGVNTYICVESTVRDAYFRDYDLAVVADAVAATDRALHDDSLKKIKLYFGSVLPSEDILDAFARLKGAVETASPPVPAIS